MSYSDVLNGNGKFRGRYQEVVVDMDRPSGYVEGAASAPRSVNHPSELLRMRPRDERDWRQARVDYRRPAKRTRR